ncbi:MAG: Probable acyl-ACP desaturase, Stearoyl-ACP desaturase, partial [uncultured Corynebacteriales bacterium]
DCDDLLARHAAPARAAGGGQPRPAPRSGQGVVPARLRAVEPRPRLRHARGRGLVAGGLPAGPGRPYGDDRQPAHRGQPSLVPPRDRGELRQGRRLGAVGRPVDRRGGPARDRAARLPRRHPRCRPGRAGAAADGAHDRRVRLRGQVAAAHGRVRVVPGAGDAGRAPQHRPGHRLPAGRAAAQPDRGRREPAHGLLPQPRRRGAGDRPGPGAGRDPRRGRRLPDAGRRDERLRPQLPHHRQGRDLRPAAAPRRGDHAGAEVLEGLRPDRRRAGRGAGPDRARRVRGRPGHPGQPVRREARGAARPRRPAPGGL